MPVPTKGEIKTPVIPPEEERFITLREQLFLYFLVLPIPIALYYLASWVISKYQTETVIFSVWIGFTLLSVFCWIWVVRRLIKRNDKSFFKTGSTALWTSVFTVVVGGTNYFSYVDAPMAEIKLNSKFWVSNTDTLLFFVKDHQLNINEYYGKVDANNRETLLKDSMQFPKKFDEPNYERLEEEYKQKGNFRPSKSEIRESVRNRINIIWTRLFEAREKDDEYIRKAKLIFENDGPTLKKLENFHDSVLKKQYAELVDLVVTIINNSTRKGMKSPNMQAIIELDRQNINATFRKAVRDLHLPQDEQATFLANDLIAFDYSDIPHDNNPQLKILLTKGYDWSSFPFLDLIKYVQDQFKAVRKQKQNELVAEFNGAKLDAWPFIN